MQSICGHDASQGMMQAKARFTGRLERHREACWQRRHGQIEPPDLNLGTMQFVCVKYIGLVPLALFSGAAFAGHGIIINY